jgi:Transposase IS116/IS110/IS902 family
MAPRLVRSGLANRARHQLSRTGHRQLNAAVHHIALTQAHWAPRRQKDDHPCLDLNDDMATLQNILKLGPLIKFSRSVTDSIFGLSARCDQALRLGDAPPKRILI